MKMIEHNGIRYRPEDAPKEAAAEKRAADKKASAKKATARNKARGVAEEATGADSDT